MINLITLLVLLPIAYVCRNFCIDMQRKEDIIVRAKLIYNRGVRTRVTDLRTGHLEYSGISIPRRKIVNHN
jgi:hypothetical protein